MILGSATYTCHIKGKPSSSLSSFKLYASRSTHKNRIYKYIIQSTNKYQPTQTNLKTHFSPHETSGGKMSRVNTRNLQTRWVPAVCDVTYPSSQFSDGNAAFDPQRVDVTEWRHSVGEVKQLLPIHEHAKATLFTVNLQLGGETRRKRMLGQFNVGGFTANPDTHTSNSIQQPFVEKNDLGIFMSMVVILLVLAQQRVAACMQPHVKK